MSLLQRPLRALDQIEWYLDHPETEQFPGAFLLAAGNLARQLLEQVVFITAFYAGVPNARFINSRGRLRSLDVIIKELRATDPASGQPYATQAGARGPRIRKFIRLSRSFDRWRRAFNEPSHFANPAVGRKTKTESVRRFVRAMRSTLDELDEHLITAAVTEIRSKGAIKAVLGSDGVNRPGVLYTVVVSPKLLEYRDGNFSMRFPPVPQIVVSKSQEVSHRWRNKILAIQDSGGMEVKLRIVSSSGHPINIAHFQSVVDAFVNDPRDRPVFVRRMKRFGLTVEVTEPPNQALHPTPAGRP